MDKNAAYDITCQFETISTLKRFIPYSIGTPSDKLSYNDNYPRANFIFFSDSHIDLCEPEASLDNVRRTLEFANDSPIRFDALVHAGDVMTPFGKFDKADSYRRLTPFFDIAKTSRSPFIFTKGNHDTNDWTNIPENVLGDRDWSELFLDFAEKEYGIVRQVKASGEKSTWHYCDIDAHKIRIISVDVQDTDKTSVNDDGYVKYYGGVSWYITNEQFDWIAHTALNFDDKEDKDWGVIFTMHQHTKGNELHESATEMLLCLCEAFNTQGKYALNYTAPNNTFLDLHVSADYSRYAAYEKKPHVICWLLGHNHEDKHEVRHGINMIWTLNNSSSDCCGDSRVARVPGTTSQNSFDIVNIDTRTRRIRIIKYGAGVNCYGIGGDRFLPDGLSY